jgi:hypothetical protein
VTLAPKGLLIEEQRTNFVANSTTHTNTEQAGVPSSLAFIDGSNANVYEANTVNAAHRAVVSGIAGGNATTTIAPSVYVKLPTNSEVIRLFFRVRSSSGSGCGIAFLVSDGVPSPLVVINSFGANAPPAIPLSSAFVVNVGNGWYRIGFSGTSSSSGADTHNRVDLGFSNETFEANPGTAFTTVAITGWQLEAGAFPTSYIPTTTAAATRAADVAVMQGANFSNWYRADEGTIYFQGDSVRPPASSPATRCFQIDDGTINQNIRSAATSSLQIIDGGVVQANLQPSPTIPFDGTVFNFASAYKLNDFASSTGGVALTDTSGTLPTVTQMVIGSTGSGAFLSGHARRIAYFPRRLANAELTSITS